MSEYKILKVIGKGAFGDAYLGLNVTQKKQYVIKQVDIKNKSKQEKQHIFNEVKLLQQFNHVNIVSYRDSFIDRKGLLNIVMEYCEGGDMNQIIESMQGNKIPEDKIVYWLAQMALAIFYMHEKKILHRDLKSPNIFILKGNIRLGDFGISKVLDHVRDLAQTNIGTPYYMSPEQYNHKPYSYKSDIWAFGCILYEMCNQRRPFEANNIQALGMKVVRGNFSPVSQCYSKDLRNLISDMLSKNPVKRPNVIEILLKPFIKKKVIEYMKEIYVKKEEVSKDCLASLAQQAKKLSIVLEEKKPVSTPKQLQTERQRSQSAKKNRIEEEKQKEKIEREKKKQELQNQLRKQNDQRKEMAQKLKKIEQQRKALLTKRKSEKNLKSIYDKVQSSHSSHQEKVDYQSQKYSKAELEQKTKRHPTQESSKNLIGKVISQSSTAYQSQKGHSSSVSQRQHSSVSVSSSSSKKQPQSANNSQGPVGPSSMEKKKIFEEAVGQQQPKSKQQNHQKQPEPQKKPQAPIQPADDKKAFKMEEEYEMEFEDCQPEEEYRFDDESDEENNDYGSSKKEQREFEVQNRVPTFASDQNKLAMEVKEIQNLVMVSNQAVQQITKKEHTPSVVNPSPGPLQKQAKKEKPKREQKYSQQLQKKEAPQPSTQTKSSPKEQQQQQKFPQQIITTKSPHQIEEKVETLKQQIKMKTMHINSIRNQLSNIDFQLSESDEQQEFGKVSLLPAHQPLSNFSKKKQQFNPQHAKINDRINMLKESANTILGTEMFKKFYEYLVTIKEKGRSVKRDYLEQVLGKEKIGAYHLVEQIVRLSRVLEKIPKWL